MKNPATCGAIGLATATLALLLDATGFAAEEPTARFIDTHVHFHHREKGALDKVAEWMKANKVQRVINHPLEQSRVRNDAERQQMLENYRNYEGRIERFCMLKPDEVSSVEEAVALLEKEKQAGAIGFGEHYGAGNGTYFDDPACMRLFAACAEVGLPVLFHMDRNRNLDEKGFPRLRRVLKTYPNLILIAHSDWWKGIHDGSCDELLQTYPNLYADISCTVKRSRIGRDKALAKAFFIRNADKLLFGSDAGWWSFRMGTPPEFALIDELDLPEDVEAKMLRGNALKLFPFRKENGDVLEVQRERPVAGSDRR